MEQHCLGPHIQQTGKKKKALKKEVVWKKVGSANDEGNERGNEASRHPGLGSSCLHGTLVTHLKHVPSHMYNSFQPVCQKFQMPQTKDFSKHFCEEFHNKIPYSWRQNFCPEISWKNCSYVWESKNQKKHRPSRIREQAARCVLPKTGVRTWFHPSVQSKLFLLLKRKNFRLHKEEFLASAVISAISLCQKSSEVSDTRKQADVLR